MRRGEQSLEVADEFTHRMAGRFVGILRWQDLDALWQMVLAEPTGWYASLVGEVPPAEPLGEDTLRRLVGEVDALLRAEHDESYCGVVYADDPAAPTLIKIYDPSNLGSSCGCGKQKHPPRWVLSRLPPGRIEDDAPLPNGRRRWWQRLIG